MNLNRFNRICHKSCCYKIIFIVHNTKTNAGKLFLLKKLEFTRNFLNLAAINSEGAFNNGFKSINKRDQAMERLKFRKFGDSNIIIEQLEQSWNERHELGEVLRYKLKIDKRKVLAGNLGILLEVRFCNILN